MIKNLNMNNLQCQFQNHQQRKIITICFHKDCQQKRLCCLKCNSDIHRSHSEKLIEIDLFQSFYQQVSNEKNLNPHTYGQRYYKSVNFVTSQVIQNLEEFSIQIDGLQKIIKEEIQRLKQSNLQQHLKEQSNDQQGIEYWNSQIEGLLQYFEVENNLLTKRNQEQGQLSELEQKSIQLINQAKDSLQLIIKQFDKPPKDQLLKFKSDPIQLEGHNDDVNGVVISSDGAIIASGSDDKTVKLWNAKTKQLLQTFQYNSEVQEVAISSNNQYLAYGGFGDYSLQLHDLQSNNTYTTLKGHTNSIWSIAFSSNSQFIFSGGQDQKLIIWNLSQKTQIHSFKTDSRILNIVTSPDNKLISCICNSSINIWDFQTKIKLIHLQEPHSVGRGLCSSKDSQIFISSGGDGLIKIWRLNQGDNNQKSLTLTREIKAAGKKIFRVILTSDEKYIISICNPEKKIMIHGIESGTLIQELKYENGGGRNDKLIVFSVFGYISISNDMNVLVSGNYGDKMVKIWTRE